MTTRGYDLDGSILPTIYHMRDVYAMTFDHLHACDIFTFDITKSHTKLPPKWPKSKSSWLWLFFAREEGNGGDYEEKIERRNGYSEDGRKAFPSN